MCGAEQTLNTSPERMETNYVRFIGMIANLDKGLSIQALCPKCASIVGNFIKINRIQEQRHPNPLNKEKKRGNRVSTSR